MNNKSNVFLGVAWLGALANSALAVNFDDIQLVLYIVSLFITIASSLVSLVIKIINASKDGKITDEEAKEIYNDTKEIVEATKEAVEEAKKGKKE